MFKNDYTLNVDLKRRLTSTRPTFRIGDTGVLRHRIYDNGRLYDISSITGAEITFELPNGDALTNDCTIENGLVVYTMSGIEVSQRGNTQTYLTIISGDTRVSIQNYSIFAYNPKNQNDITYIGALQGLIEETQRLGLEVQPLIDELNEVIDNLDVVPYNDFVSIKRLNFVTYRGSTYIALRDVTGVTPTDDGVNYRLAAVKGAEGGVQSVNGSLPDINGNVVLQDLLDHERNLTENLHIEVLPSIPTDLSRSGIIITTDGANATAGLTPTLDQFEDDVRDILNGYETQYENEILNINNVVMNFENKVHNIEVLPSEFGAMGDGLTNETLIINELISNGYKNINLEGKSYLVDRIIVSPNLKIYNGTLIANDLYIIFGSNAHNFKLENVKFNGNNISESAIRLNNSDNIEIMNCEIFNCKTSPTNLNVTAGIWLNRCNKYLIKYCNIHDIIGTPNSVIGDDNGASRGIYFNECLYGTTSKCYFNNILSNDDGDAIHYRSTETIDGNNEVSYCTFNNCDSRFIKIQQNGVNVSYNNFTTSDDFNTLRVGGITIYGDNVNINNNRIRANTVRPIIIGGGDTSSVSNIYVENNIIDNFYLENQACVIIVGSPIVYNIYIYKNKLIGNNLNHSGVDIRSYCDNIQIMNNEFDIVRYGVHIRTASSGTPVNIVRRNIQVVSNVGNCREGIVYTESLNTIELAINNLLVRDNTVEVTNALTNSNNTVRLTQTQYELFPVIENNKSGTTRDGLLKVGSTAGRPTYGVKIGDKYYDTTLNLEIIFDGTNWRNSSGTLV